MRFVLIHFVLIVLGCIGCYTTACAQQVDPLSEAAFARLQATLEEAVTRHTRRVTDTRPILSQQIALALLDDRLAISPTSLPALRVLEARKKWLRRDIGLNLRGGYLENVEQGVLDADGIFYRRRLNLEIGWDLFSGGLLANRLSARALDNDIEAATVRASASIRTQEYSRRYNQIIQFFNEAKIPFLEERVALLNDLLAVSEELYRTDYLAWDRVMELKNQRAQAEVQLINFRTYNHQMNALLGDDSLDWLLVDHRDDLLNVSLVTDMPDANLSVDPLRDNDGNTRTSATLNTNSFRGDVSRPMTLYGRVTDLDTGVGLRGIHMILQREAAPAQRREIWTNDEGRYFFTDVPGGRWRVKAVHTADTTRLALLSPVLVLDKPMMMLHFELPTGSKSGLIASNASFSGVEGSSASYLRAGRINDEQGRRVPGSDTFFEASAPGAVAHTDETEPEDGVRNDTGIDAGNSGPPPAVSRDNAEIVTVSSISRRQIPIFTLSAERLIQLLDAQRTPDRIVELEVENLRLQGHPLRAVSLSPFIRYNVYHDPDTPGKELREFFSAGVSFSIPLAFRRGARNALVEATRETRIQEIEEEAFIARKEVLNHYYEYEYNLKQYIAFFEKEQTLQYRIEQTLTDRRLGDPAYSATRILSLLDELLAVQVEQVDIRQKMYLKLLKIGSYVEPGSLTNILEPIEAATWLPPRDAPSSVYVWSQTFETLDNARLIEHLRHNRVGEVFLSLGGDAHLVQKARAFVQAARAADISVQLMIGSNVLIYPRNHDRLNSLVAQARALEVQGIHLDVEPHTFDDWDAKRAEYLDQYVQMLQKARRLTDEAGLRLGVSVPPQYGRQTLQTLLGLCDDIVVMSYGRTDPSAVERAVRDLLALDPGKVRLALRPADFPNTKALQDFIITLAGSPAISRIALHDLESLLSLKSHSPAMSDEE